MPSTFRDYIRDSKIELPQSAIDPTTSNKKYEELSDNAQNPTYTSETPNTIAKNNDYTSLYVSDDNIKKLSQSTPLIGDIINAVDEVKDSWTRARQNWKTVIDGLKDVSENPQMTYWLANSLLRYLNGAEKVLPYNSDLDTSNLIVKLVDSLGLGNILNKLGIGKKGGEPFMYSDYTEEDYTKYTPKSSSEITSSGTENQERSGSSPTSKGKGEGTKKYIHPFFNIPLFSFYGDGSFGGTPAAVGVSSDPSKANNDGRFFSFESYLGKTGKTLEDLATSIAGPSYKITSVDIADNPAAWRKYINYSLNSSPYVSSDRPSSGPIDNALYALETLNALHGYEPYSKFSPRNDNLWSIRLYPYSPGMEYQNSRKENVDYYNGTLTPPLPITYIPYWIPNNENGKEGFTMGIYEYDWEKYTPIQSYELGFGTLQSSQIRLFNGSIQVPNDFEWNTYIQLTILDDVDATFQKYLAYYFNRTILKEKTAIAPFEYSAFVIELIIFKPALKVNFHFKFIGVPLDYDYHFSGSESDSTESAAVTLNMQIIGMKNYTNNEQMRIGDTVLPDDIIHKPWNNVILTP